MKKLVLTIGIALISCVISIAQHAELMMFSGEIKVEKLEKDEVYKKLSSWQQEYMPKETIVESDRGAGEIKGTSYLIYNSNVHAASEVTKGFILFDFKFVAVEDGFRYQITNFRHEGKIRFHTILMTPSFPYKINAVEKPWYDLVWKDIRTQITQQTPKMVASVKDVIEKAALLAKNESEEKDTLLSQIGN
ncbi:DUF4468 domain-containing protein [Cytophagaceae bacterium YF14B1]|uniref:DUF4468 domain-containing protein n=1 Tax=Xanthocytophaga flava TaxID=3048013 RepID=A0AAE3QWN9_9BACT|nr:DUF4468 domain-containing protein [Xanthocytophaga flavus]MDJ1484783.1 DUF4468 domain-containing protein [Xanthocytophaga flavus]